MDIASVVNEIAFLEKVEQFYCDYEDRNGNVFTDLERKTIDAIQDRLDELEDCMLQFEKEMQC